jgi:ABC-type thiamin/hydroxymethylpyrimidine transport system permease subunit
MFQKKDGMRPRDIINRRKKSYLMLIGVSFAGMFLLAFLEKHIPANMFKPVSYAAIGSFIAGNLLLHFGILCPKCKAIIGYAIVYSSEKVDQCPRCRIHFDVDM